MTGRPLLNLAILFGCMAFWNVLQILIQAPSPVDSWWHRALLDVVFVYVLVYLENR